MDLIKELNKEALQKEITNVQVGDTIRVHVKVKEGSRERIQEAWRHRGDHHRSPYFLRCRRGEGVPRPLSFYRPH